MLLNSSRRPHVDLSFYNYQSDIEHRLMMAHFTEFEVEVLREVLDGPLRFSVTSLALALDAFVGDVAVAIESLQRTKLLKLNQGEVLVDKELRKYYESQIEKFDDDFESDVEFALGMLKRVPIHVLPNWYGISKSSDDIFASIIEKHLLTPEIYRRYIEEICFGDSVAAGIIEEVLSAPDFKVCGKHLREKYKLSNEQFEEKLLRLEFQLVCFLSYSRIDGEWTEVVTPLHEWRQFLRFQRDALPKGIQEQEVERYRTDDFGFIMDLAALLRASEHDGIPLHEGLLDLFTARIWLSKVSGERALNDPAYTQLMVNCAMRAGLAEVVGDRLQAFPEADKWLKQSMQEQALILYRSMDRATERDLRSVEKSLKRLIGAGWVTFDDFMKGFIRPIGDCAPISLIKKGKRWRYEVPIYSSDQRAFIHRVVFQQLFHVGMTAIGSWNGLDCFKITSFGKFTLGE